MNILHITVHMGGGVGSVIMGWVSKDTENFHEICCLDYANEKSIRWANKNGISMIWNCASRNKARLEKSIKQFDIVLVHYWNHPMLAELFSRPIPDCRLIFWCHENFSVHQKELEYPDLFLDVSPIQGHGGSIWSTGGVDRFLEIKPKPHEGFNIGYVGTVDFKKMHKDTFKMCEEIAKKIPDVHFTFVGDVSPEVLHSLFQPPPYPPYPLSSYKYTLTGQVDDVAPLLAEMDILGYPLRPDHYGTCEQALGEAMAAGVVPVVMDNPAERLIVTTFLNGYVADSPEQYISFIESFYLKSSIGRKIVADRAKKRVAELYFLDTMIQKWNEVFEEMMKRPKRKRGTL